MEQRIAFATEERNVRIRETTTGNEIKSLTVPSLIEDDDYLQFLAFSPDGTRLVTASRDKMVRVWDIADGRQVAALEHPSPIGFARFSPDGTRLATVTGDTTVRLWDVTNGREPGCARPSGCGLFRSPSARTARISSQAASTAQCKSGTLPAPAKSRPSRDIRRRYATPASARTGARIVTASKDGTARVWDTAKRSELLVLTLGRRLIRRRSARTGRGSLPALATRHICSRPRQGARSLS